MAAHTFMPFASTSREDSTQPRRVWLDAWTFRFLAIGWGALLIEFTAFRLAFLVRYWPSFSAAPVSVLLSSLALGLRFDVAAIFGLTCLPALALLAAGNTRIGIWAGALWLGLTGALILVLGLLSGIDLYYYGFVGRRVSFELWGLRREAAPIAAMVWQGYRAPALTLAASLLAWLAGSTWALARALRCPHPRVPWAIQAAQGTALLVLIVFGARGGAQVKPLSENMAFRSSNMALGHLALNPAFTAIKALDRRQTLLAYVQDEQANADTRQLLGLGDPPLNPHYPLLRMQSVPPLPKPRNLVFLTLESFSPQYMGVFGASPDVAEHFTQLAREGLLFTEFYASGTRSLEGIPAILTGYPALPTSALIGSPLEQSRMASVPRILQDAGYTTLFLHGAFRGSMWFDQFAARSGFDKYIAKEDFSDPAGMSDSTWGIFDHYALERLHAELEAARKPVFAFFFSLSSHTPYDLPDAWVRRFPASVPHSDLLNAFAYADWSLGRFFALARASNYWRDTVFVITADHNVGGAGLTRRQAMHIPLLMLVPGDPSFPRGAVRTTLGGQVDLAPTVLQLLGISAAQDFAGNSLLAPAAHRFVMFGLGGQAAWLDENVLVLHDLAKAVAAFRYRRDPGLTRNVLPELSQGGTPEVVREFESYLQATNNLLLRNLVFPANPPRR